MRRPVNSPVVGTVLEVLTEVGAAVTAGEELVLIESMKMEIPVAAATAGTVASIDVAAGAFVQVGDSLLTIDD